jgi:hypothetical protein
MYRGKNVFKKGYQLRINLVKIVDSYNNVF